MKIKEIRTVTFNESPLTIVTIGDAPNVEEIYVS